MLILTSDGISSDKLLTRFQQCLSKLSAAYKKAAIITTASNPFAEKNPDIEKHIVLVETCSLSADCVDIETTDPNILKAYDVIIIIGGNPYYLLGIMQKKNCKPLFTDLHKDGHIIVGMSAGSMVLGTTIDFVNSLTPEMGINMSDYSGLSLVNMVICPHADTFVASIKDSEKKLTDYENANNCKITRINDGEAVFIDY